MIFSSLSNFKTKYIKFESGQALGSMRGAILLEHTNSGGLGIQAVGFKEDLMSQIASYRFT
jgi:hypothetical protein